MCVGIALEAACCAGKEFCSVICTFFKCCCKMTMSQQIRLSYVILNSLLFAFTIIVLHYIRDLFSYFARYLHCPEASGGQSQCLGSSSVYRMSFALAILYLAVLIAVYARNQCSKLFNEGLWCIKISAVLGMYISFMFVSDSFFNGYRVFAQVFGGFYLLFQTIILIDIFYLWGQNWKAKYDEVEAQNAENNSSFNLYGILLIGITLSLYTASILLNAYNFIWFKGCQFNIIVNALNLLLVISITFVQFLGFNPSGSLLTSSAMSFYITFLAFSGQLSSESGCNSAISSNAIFAIELSVGVAFLLVTLLYLSFVKKNINNIQNQQNKKEDLEKEQASLVQNQQQLNQQQDELEIYKNTNNYIIFHMVMFVSSIYCAMLITNWGGSSLNNFTIYQPSQTSYWIKIICSWISSILYIWTLIAPRVFPNRDFS
ncbi:membrane protein tms1, putative [Ichthyophthirius multifiliis]|uniref:Membrane protein tms1, putative n=1 Tax=Ichthyophthirius multifiliis TaxID=5932 RepID=G0R0W9_ICHMU|nr:membrane protein tms1, putative [Ichthyophthirius multifiliis]EGR28880.1 membrane protein tms1, putative [Ichthyophthirius multifiliis]|eukprot:XP_004030116.1 membrane protein tms1, putative [Ichthyophthirius multifiliis]